MSELLEGETLGERLRSGRLSVRESALCAEQIAHALAAAHAKGVVHRDLKPENVFLTREGVVKLLDFGVAKLVEGLPERDLRTTGSTKAGGSTLMGTPGYMAPEQMEGRADHRTDLFALGAVLYRTLTGRSALSVQTTVQVPGAVAEPSPPFFAAADGVPTVLQRIVHRCLETRPDDRFQSAEELSIALRGFVDSEEARDRRRRRISTAATSVGLGVVVALAALAEHSSRMVAPGRPIRSLAVLPFRGDAEASSQEYLVDGVTDGLIAEIARTSLREVRLIARGSVMRFKARGVKLPEVARELDVDAVVQGTVHRTGSMVRLDAHLDSVPSGERLWTQTYEGPVGELALLQRRIARAVAIQIGSEAVLDRELPRRRPPQTLEAGSRSRPCSRTRS